MLVSGKTDVLKEAARRGSEKTQERADRQAGRQRESRLDLAAFGKREETKRRCDDVNRGS